MDLWIGVKKAIFGHPPYEMISGNTEFALSSLLWDPGQPNGSPGDPQNCMVLYKNVNFKVQDRSCGGSYYPLCEIPGFQNFA